MEKKIEFVVTDGSVEYKHTKPMAEFDNKTPSVKLNFQLAEGSDPQAVSEHLMGIAMVVVEKAIATNVVVASAEQVKVGRPQKANPPSAPVADAEPTNSASGASTTDAAAITDETEAEVVPTPEPEPEEKKLTLKEDVQPLAQKVSAKLRKEFGNITALRDVFEACGSTGKNLTGMPEDQWPKFMIEAKKLLEE